MIEVIQADYPNRAVCRPDNKLLTDQIQKGDHVKADIKSPLSRRPRRQPRRNIASRGPTSTRSCWLIALLIIVIATVALWMIDEG